ncbi:MAG: hypothetical protein CMF69_04565 [Magnetovibrio sp.]|nr:hypothetical protein [Magnetovibrio sp.]|tara:strand:+ start:365 stop:850 length:486 start_codon:yes stop_codon:yes gene_type:complete
MNGDKFKYDYIRYNHYLVLRPNVLLKLILCFLCKDVFLILVIGASAFKGGGGGSLSDLMDLVRPIFFLANIPTLAVLYAWSARRPNAPSLPRSIWKNGRSLILLSLALYVFLLLFERGWSISSLSTVDWCAVAINIIIAGYILLSNLVRDIFSQFPEPGLK